MPLAGLFLDTLVLWLLDFSGCQRAMAPGPRCGLARWGGAGFSYCEMEQGLSVVAERPCFFFIIAGRRGPVGGFFG